MNLGDGLKLETQILDGKPKLFLAPCAKDSKISRQTGSKKALQTQPVTVKPTVQILKATQNNQILKATPNGPVLKATQNTFVKTEKPFSKKRTGSGLSETKSEKSSSSLASKKPHKDLPKQLPAKGQDSIIQRDDQTGKPSIQKTNISVKKTSQSTALSKQKTFKKPTISAEVLRESLVCLTQEQFQQILTTINQATRITDQVKDDAEQATVQDNSENQSIEESIGGLLQKSVPAQEDAILPSETQNHGADQKSTGNDGDLFSTLGERERDKTLLEAKKSQWRKELDEQVALKKKQKESLVEQIKYGVWSNSTSHGKSIARVTTAVQPQISYPAYDQAEADSMLKERLGLKAVDVARPVSNGLSGKTSTFSSPDLPAAIRTAFILGEAAPLDHPFSAQKREQQKKWIEELNKQREEDSLRKLQEKLKFSEVEEHDKWAVHFDSLKKTNTPQLPLNAPLTQQFPNPHPISSPQETIDVFCLERDNNFENSAETQTQKTSYLRTMTALLDPVQIEERDRKRQKQLEHQKAIAAQVEEKRRRKQMEEEARQREEQDEEQRLALERQMIQKQFEDDLLKQKRKEEVLDRKTKELHQSMQRAQEEAQMLKQEQRIRALAQKGHNISNLQMNLGGNPLRQSYGRIDSSLSGLNREMYPSENNDKMNKAFEIMISPRIDTAVQTDEFIKLGINTHPEAYSNEIILRVDSPDIPIEFKDYSNYKKQKTDPKQATKKIISRKENTCVANEPSDQRTRRDSHVKPGQNNVRKPDWNTNKTGRKYVPASEKYPQGHQKQREENKARRQMELLHLVERNMSHNVHPKHGASPQITPSPREDKKENTPVSKVEHSPKRDPHVRRRSESPPVPAVKNKLQQLQQRHLVVPEPPVLRENGGKERNPHRERRQSELSPANSETECHRPPSSHFIPYVRTKEVYYLDPEAPMSRPSTHDPQYSRQKGGDHHPPRQIFSSDNTRDPLLNPNLVKNKDRQQAILKGLSELRQGLLQKQRELESCLITEII